MPDILDKRDEYAITEMERNDQPNLTPFRGLLSTSLKVRHQATTTTRKRPTGPEEQFASGPQVIRLLDTT
jgi:hypothetical protein